MPTKQNSIRVSNSSELEKYEKLREGITDLKLGIDKLKLIEEKNEGINEDME